MITAEKRKIAKDKFIIKLGGMDAYREYMSRHVLQNYYMKKFSNIKPPQIPKERKRKYNHNINDIKQHAISNLNKKK